ncbi:hypothetical protein KUCAC02_029622, partial [Chaenocephalus aceratus]
PRAGLREEAPYGRRMLGGGGGAEQRSCTDHHQDLTPPLGLQNNLSVPRSVIGRDTISSLTYSTRSNTSLRRYRSPPADIRRLAIGRGKVTVVHQRRVLDTPLMHRCVRSHGSASGEKREDLSTRIGRVSGVMSARCGVSGERTDPYGPASKARLVGNKATDNKRLLKENGAEPVSTDLWIEEMASRDPFSPAVNVTYSRG